MTSKQEERIQTYRIAGGIVLSTVPIGFPHNGVQWLSVDVAWATVDPNTGEQPLLTRHVITGEGEPA